MNGTDNELQVLAAFSDGMWRATHPTAGRIATRRLEDLKMELHRMAGGPVHVIAQMPESALELSRRAEESRNAAREAGRKARLDFLALVLALYDGTEMTAEEVGVILGLKLKTVKNLAVEARAELAKSD